MLDLIRIPFRKAEPESGGSASLRFGHYRDVPAAVWRWPNFTPREIACRGSGEILIVPGALDILQALRDAVGAPLTIHSAYRSEVHNARIGGAPRSKHLEGTAFDIGIAGHDKRALLALAREVGFLGFGFYTTFLHADTGPARTWGTPPWN